MTAVAYKIFITNLLNDALHFGFTILLKQKREDDKKAEEKQNNAIIMISVDGKGTFFQWSYNYKENRLNKDIGKENFKKDLMNLFEANHQINITSVHSVSSNNSFKSHLNVKVLKMSLTL